MVTGKHAAERTPKKKRNEAEHSGMQKRELGGTVERDEIDGEKLGESNRRIGGKTGRDAQKDMVFCIRPHSHRNRSHDMISFCLVVIALW